MSSLYNRKRLCFGFWRLHKILPLWNKSKFELLERYPKCNLLLLRLGTFFTIRNLNSSWSLYFCLYIWPNHKYVKYFLVLYLYTKAAYLLKSQSFRYLKQSLLRIDEVIYLVVNLKMYLLMTLFFRLCCNL